MQIYFGAMVNEDEMIALEQRAHAARITMRQLCKRAQIFPQSWHRARKRGKANYTLIDPLEKAMTIIEAERKAINGESSAELAK